MCDGWRVYFTIPFAFSLFLYFFVWLSITAEGSVHKMRIWSILLIQSDLKWCIRLRRSLFLYWIYYLHYHINFWTALLWHLRFGWLLILGLYKKGYLQSRMVVVIPTHSSKSVRNRSLIKFAVGLGAFAKGPSQISFFFSSKGFFLSGNQVQQLL